MSSISCKTAARDGALISAYHVSFQEDEVGIVKSCV